MEQLQAIADRPTVTSAEKLWQNSKHLGLKKKTVTDFWRNQSSVQVVRGQPISKSYQSIKCWTGNIGCCQIDLMDISKYKGHNNNKTFLFNCVDIFSRYAWSFPVANKRPATILPHLKKVVRDYRKQCSDCIITIHSDDGSEWKGVFDKYLKAQGIRRVQTLHKQNQAIIERFNQTLWSFFNISFFSKNNFRFIDHLSAIIDSYNSDRHSTIKQSPRDVFTEKKLPIQAHDVEFDLTTKLKKSDDDIKIGSLVRRQINRATFDKGSASAKFSKQVYKVVEKKFNRYVIQNVETGDNLATHYLPRELSYTSHVTAVPNQRRERVLTHKNKVARRNASEPSFKLDEGERRRLQPKTSRRQAKKPARFRGDGIVFYV